MGKILAYLRGCGAGLTQEGFEPAWTKWRSWVTAEVSCCSSMITKLAQSVRLQLLSERS